MLRCTSVAFLVPYSKNTVVGCGCNYLGLVAGFTPNVDEDDESLTMAFRVLLMPPPPPTVKLWLFFDVSADAATGAFDDILADLDAFERGCLGDAGTGEKIVRKGGPLS